MKTQNDLINEDPANHHTGLVIGSLCLKDNETEERFSTNS